jgi:hypothetical protein
MPSKIKAVVMNAENIALVVSVLALLGAFYPIMTHVSQWAQTSFARPLLASCLIAVIDVALFLVALAIAPALSRLLVRVIRWPLFLKRDK